MIVCIAEKPSVARDIAAVLGATQRHDGYMEGHGYQVTWTFGHLCTLKEPHEYTPQWRSWHLSDLPMIPPRFSIKLIDNDGYRKQFGVIENLVKGAEMVINCGDAGQEGELIQRWVLQKAGCSCPVKRLWISSLTTEAIKEGFNALKPQEAYQSLYEAGLLRAIGDWLLGMNATRLFTLKYGREKQVLSLGRVQTPTLALIVNRQREIDQFVPQPYWELKTVYRETTFSSVKGRFGAKEEAADLLARISGEPFVITGVSAKKGTEAPLRLFDLTSLQVECNKKFGYSADETLKLIQALYEKKLTTYPRVDTTYLSDDIYPKVGPTLKGLVDYSALTAPLLDKPLPKSKKVFDNSKVTDHHAIIPTGVKPGSLTLQEQKVYDLVTRRFIAAFYPDCKFSTTTVLGEAARVEFKTTGKQILEPGWRVVFEADSAATQAARNGEGGAVAVKGVNAGGGATSVGSDGVGSDEDDAAAKDEERTLPTFIKGESGPHVPDLAEKQTQPPKPYTEATLLRAMETAGKLVDDDDLRDALKENGIGRPSTRASIIETLFKRQYIRKERKNLLPTPTGTALIDFIHVDLLKSASLTGLWEKKLRQIERKEYNAAQFLEELKAMVLEVVKTA